MNYDYERSNKGDWALLLDKIKKWYADSTLKYFWDHEPPNRKGDNAGLWLSLATGFLQWVLMSLLPIYVFWILIAVFDRTGTTLEFLNLIVGICFTLCIPQYFFLVEKQWNYFLNKTGFKI